MSNDDDQKGEQENAPDPEASADANIAETPTFDPLLVTVGDTRQLLRIGKTQVFQLANAGVLERRRVGGSTRITMRSIRKLAGV